LKASASGVLSGESRSTAGTESRPLLTSVRAKAWRLVSVQHRVAEQAAHLALGRDEVGRARGVADVLVGRVFALARVAVEQRIGRVALSTAASFHARLSASCTPELAPRAPKGDTPCAESPANSTRPWRKRSMRWHAKV
jgi:hypothetical protein